MYEVSAWGRDLYWRAGLRAINKGLAESYAEPVQEEAREFREEVGLTSRPSGGLAGRQTQL